MKKENGNVENVKNCLITKLLRTFILMTEIKRDKIMKIVLVISVLLNLYFIGLRIFYYYETKDACNSFNENLNVVYDWKYGFLSACKYEY